MSIDMKLGWEALRIYANQLVPYDLSVGVTISPLLTLG